MKQDYDLAGKIIGCAMRVHSALGPGFLESVYQNALAFELKQSGLTVELEKKIPVYYREQCVGDFIADMFINDCLIVENKAVQSLVKAHEAQLVHYLTSTGIDEGVLLNFGAERLEYKKKFRLPQQKKELKIIHSVHSV
ncbi:MAG: GxxExxY protein [Verrucomicrobiota bacterium]